jgi:probable rRNA maturation factor
MSKTEAARLLKSLENPFFKKLKIKNSRLELLLLTDREMDAVRKELSFRPDFRGAEAKKIKEEEYVSILSFPEAKGFPHPENRRKMLGEIYINYEFSEGDSDLLIYLFIHGFLHLLGYDHLKKRARMEMEKLEKKLFVFAVSRRK